MDVKELFKDIDRHLLEDKRPSIFLNKLKEEGKLNEGLFKILGNLETVQQEKKYHPEGSVWNHTMMVVDEAAARRDLCEDKRSFMWAALLHDIGKEKTTVKRNGRWTSYDHDSVGAEMVRRFLRELSEDEDFNDKVIKLIRYHMHNLYVNKNLPYAKVTNMIEEISVQEVGLLSLCDRLARGDMTEEQKKEVYEKTNKFLDIVGGKASTKYNHFSM